MKKFGVQLLYLFLIVFVLCNLLSYISLIGLRNSSFYKPSYITNLNTNPNYDYVVIGASTGLTTLNTTVIDSLTNLHGFNLAIDDTSMSSHYLMLQHAIAEGFNFDYVILATSTSSYLEESKSISDNDYRFLSFVNRQYVQDYFAKFKGFDASVSKWSKYLPVLGVAYYNTEVFYPGLISIVDADRRNRFDSSGNYTYPEINYNQAEIISRKQMKISFESGYLKKIQELCESENIKLITYFSPMKKWKINYDSTSIDFQAINHSDLLNYHELFYDDIHVSTKGNYICSTAFAEEFNQIRLQDLK